MTDRELLEAAAKAAGIEKILWHDKQPGGWLDGCGAPSTWWDPLDDDGDALRLAVKLRLDINFNCDQVHALGSGCFAHEEFLSADEFPAATRRAIVRAAAKVNS